MTTSYRNVLKIGLWLSLVERFVRDEEAAGSNPASPTMFHMAFCGMRTLVRPRNAERHATLAGGALCGALWKCGGNPASPTISINGRPHARSHHKIRCGLGRGFDRLKRSIL